MNLIWVYCFIIIPEEEKSTNVYKCVAQIIQQNNMKNILFQSLKLNEIAPFLTNNNFSKIVVNSEKKIEFHGDSFKYYNNVMVINNVTDFEREILLFYRTFSYNPRGKHLIIFMGKNIDTLFAAAWKFKILNIVVFIEENLNVNVYSYFPYTESECENTKPYLLGTCDQKIDFFSYKRTLDLHKCPVKILTVIYEPYVINPYDMKNPGFEIIMFNEIAKIINFTPIYVKHQYKHLGFKYGRGNYSNMYKMLYNYEGEILIGNIKMNYSFHDEFDTSMPLYREDVKWFAPLASELAPWKNFIIGFQYYLWIGVIIAFFITVFSWWIFGNICKDPYYQKLINCLMNVCASLFNGCVKQPKILQQRFVFIAWVITAFLLSTAYNTKFTSILTNPYYDDQISNEKEITSSGLEFGFDLMSKGEFNFPQDKVRYKIYEKHIICPHEVSTVCLNRTLFNKDLVYAKNKKFVIYYLKHFYKFADTKSKIYMFKKSIYNYDSRILMNQGYPLLHRINDLVLRIHCSGLLIKWNRGILPIPLTNTEETIVKKISLTHLRVSFLMLFFGYFLGSVIFLIELLIHYIYRTKY